MGEARSVVRRIASALEEAAYLSGAEIEAIMIASANAAGDPEVSTKMEDA
ncbi:hypothetical protein [Methylobacterium brachythecii]|uniref:Uncharacterized protein n=1 Tax=Methylobacterium brachythecii TaxID=1176177 RepID=A0A7W6AJS9_9HYPH|nr:hypothetical protein [Methylobacterium brachythecii]MBB3903973.1 hypothetical protein [Methylobacterium brachythecii]